MRLLEQIEPTVNLSTITDGRGGILTYLPNGEQIVEWNLIDLKQGHVRGMHWHPHFTEYLLFVDGHGLMLSADVDALEDPAFQLNVARGTCTRAEPGVAHTVLAITDLLFVAMLTRRWDDSDPPIIPVRSEEFGL